MPLTNQDGGRDAFVRQAGSDQSGLVVFQVKYAEKPDALDDPRKWVLEAVKKELPKIERLMPLGLEHYRLITNVRGSGHLGTGSIDKLDQVLDQLPVPAGGWWRDDLLGRLDSSWDIKWSFPELFTGPDLLRAIIESGLGENSERRSSAMSAFLADQYDEDARVKFKQVELENRLLDLYVDVELTSLPSDARRGSASEALVKSVGSKNTASSRSTQSHPKSVFFEDGWARRRPAAGAASVLLADHGYRANSWVVIQGAPGQGKSTVTQYVCQVHRMRLLGLVDDLAHLNKLHRDAQLRLPFRVDLRDLAGWLHGRNPFGHATDSNSEGKRSLETFFAAQVETGSGGVTFSVADLHAVIRVSSMLFVFDGLDEVADIDERHRVVREVTAGLRRLNQVSASLQAVVTTRPAAFENSPGFDTDNFDYYELIDLGTAIIDQYAARWIKARGLRPRESADVRSVLTEKLGQPHMRELARNPMQLAILLSLINKRGPSLPDKRTALYDSYVNTFFDREAEKTEDVQRHRELLMELHQYLAWSLQADAEKGRSQGSISEDDLRLLVVGYLTAEEKDTSLVDVLFKSLVERVVAIVSRVQGTYEFEVQPLREYFAARYLYDNASYSPVGAERTGDKTDRFDALARNFYWLNVTRFFAGCYSKGELPSLTDRIETLASDPTFGQTNQPRILAVMLLSDWVFAQHPKSVSAVVKLILSDFATRGGESGTSKVVTLPEGSGRRELIERCWQLVGERLPTDRAHMVLTTLKVNCESTTLDATWLKNARKARGADRHTWLRYGLWIGALGRATDEDLMGLIPLDKMSADQLKLILDARHGGLIDRTRTWAERALSAILDGEISAPGGIAMEPTCAMDAIYYGFSSMPERWEPLPHWWHDKYDETREASMARGEPEDCWKFLDVVREQLSGDPARWATSLIPWTAIVEELRTIWGERWLAVELAISAAGVRSSEHRGSLGYGLFDKGHSLCERTRYARLRAGAGKWWSRQLADAPTPLDETMVVVLFFAWGSARTTTNEIHIFDAWVNTAGDIQRTQLHAAITRSSHLQRQEQRKSQLDLSRMPESLDPATVGLLSRRASMNERVLLVERYLSDYDGDDSQVWRTFVQAEIEAAAFDGSRWSQTLAVIERSYLAGTALGMGFGGVAEDSETALPYNLAQTIVCDAQNYPLSLVDAAERVCRREVGGSVDSVADVAARQGW